MTKTEREQELYHALDELLRGRDGVIRGWNGHTFIEVSSEAVKQARMVLAYYGGPAARAQAERPECAYCDQPGHTASDCPRIPEAQRGAIRAAFGVPPVAPPVPRQLTWMVGERSCDPYHRVCSDETGRALCFLDRLDYKTPEMWKVTYGAGSGISNRRAGWPVFIGEAQAKAAAEAALRSVPHPRPVSP